MSTIAVLGKRHRVEGFALAGATVLAVDDAAGARAAWAGLADDVEVVILTPAAAAALGDEPLGRPLRVVLPP